VAALLLLSSALMSAPALAGRSPAPMTCKGTARLRTCAVALPPGVTVHSNKVQVLVPADYDKHPGCQQADERGHRLHRRQGVRRAP
jgi:hypothetical protein